MTFKPIGSFALLGVKKEVTDAVMKDGAQFALLVATEQIASFAERFAPEMQGKDGELALLTFARAIRSTSAKTWKKNEA